MPPLKAPSYDSSDGVCPVYDYRELLMQRVCGPPSAAVHRRETVKSRQRPGPVQRQLFEIMEETLRYSGRAAGFGRWLAAARSRSVTMM